MSSTMNGRVKDPNDTTGRLVAAGKVNGTAVYDMKGERLGSVEDIMIDKVSGNVNYAVLSFGGFLGIGSSYHPLPWNELTYDTSLGGYVVDRTKEQLEGAPTYSSSELRSWDDAVYSGRIDDYYNGLS